MSKEISSTTDDTHTQSGKDTTTNEPLNCKTDDSNTSQTLETETNDRTLIPPVSTLPELPKEGNPADPLPMPFVDENFESTEITQGFNETECVKFAEKLYKVFSYT